MSPGTLGQVKAAIKKAGFYDVVEVAEGAEITSINEAEELHEKITEGKGFMTTSCCAAYMELIYKHIPYLKDRHSTSLSPMGYMVNIIKERYPDAKMVFIGPCLAKKAEVARRYKDISGVITFAELASVFVAKGIDVREMEAEDLGKTESFEDCREFAVTTGVAACVMRRFQAEGINARTLPINGLDKKTVRLMKTWERRAPDAELVEVMACEGGCIAGPGTIVKPALALKLRGQKAAPAKAK